MKWIVWILVLVILGFIFSYYMKKDENSFCKESKYCFRKEGGDILYLIVKHRLEKYGWKCEKCPKAIKIYKTEDNYLYYDLKTLHLLVVSGIDLNMVIADDFKIKSIRENLL